MAKLDILVFITNIVIQKQLINLRLIDPRYLLHKAQLIIIHIQAQGYYLLLKFHWS